MKDSRQNYLRDLDARWPEMAAQFRAAIRWANANIDEDALRRAIQANDIDAVLAAINITPGLFGEMAAAIAAAYTSAGRRSTQSVVDATKRRPVGRRVIGGFDPGNPGAARQAAELGAQMVQGIQETQREAVRSVIRDALLAGEGPDGPARVIAGKVVDGKRKGGLVGLTDQDAGYMRMMREALLNPDGPDAPINGAKKFWIGQDGKLKSAYSLRNKRFDGMIRRAIEEGKPLSENDTIRALDGFRNKLLKKRGDNIAQSEIAAAQTAGQDEAYRQMLENDQIADVHFDWDSAGDAKVRPTHAAADGQRVRHGEAFVVGGHRLMGPGDRSLGAPASETNRCRCWKRPIVSLL